MEEDVEIEMLLNANEKILLEAAKETNQLKSKDIFQPGKITLSSVEETKSSQNKENLTGNMIYNYEETFHSRTYAAEELGIVPQINESKEKNIKPQEDAKYNFKSSSKKQNIAISSVNEECFQEVSHMAETNDVSVNENIFDVSNDPVKHFLLNQGSFISRTDEEFRYQENVSINGSRVGDNGYEDVILGKKQLEPPQRDQYLGNATFQKNKKDNLVPQIISLVEKLWKRNDYLLLVEERLFKLLKEIQDRRKELTNALVEKAKVVTKETNSSRCSFKKFGIPYFSDDKGFFPPPNKDHQQKLDKDELMIETIPKANNWIKSHKELMKSAIKHSLIAEKSAKLSKEILKLKTVLNEAVEDNNCNVGKLQREITEKQCELRCLHKKSLSELVESENHNREYDWMKFSVSLFDGQHTADECKRFWHLYLKPNINKSAWSDFEDKKLIQIAAQMEFKDWEKIANLLDTNRSAFQCFVRYKAGLEGSSDFSSGKWTEQEDKKLLTVINSSKVGNFIPWTKISSYMKNRDHNQIYNRWANSLNPELVKGRFSKEEDLLIVSGIEVFGVNFKDLASLMNNRTSSQIRERYERHLLPKTKKVGTWSLEEDEKLLKLVQKYGDCNWAKISDELKIRTRTQVRQRYNFIKKMRKKYPGWTIDQVKRRSINVTKNASRINRDVANIKRDIDEVANAFHLSKLQKDSFITEKLKELRNRVFLRKSYKKERKGKEVSSDVKKDNTILDFFTNCYPKSLRTTKKFLFKDIDSKWNNLLFLKKFFGYSLNLPKSEKEIDDNQRLSFACKCFLKCVFNTNLEENSSRCTTDKQISSQSLLTTEESNSAHGIDCPVPEHDDTIIMMDWWHTPPVEVSSLNFNELFKRIVFDYSYGLHKDIWDAKVRRSQVVRTTCNYSDDEQTLPLTQNYSYIFPPNKCTMLAKRSISLSRSILERQSRGMVFGKHTSSNPLFKRELEDSNEFKVKPDVVYKACSEFTANLVCLLAWPQVLSVTKIGRVPHLKVHRSRKRRLQRNSKKKNTTVSSIRKDSIEENEEADCSTSKSILKKKVGLRGKAKQEHHLTINDNREEQSIHLRNKRKSSNESLETVRKRNCKRQKKSESNCVKRSTAHTDVMKNNLSEGNQSDIEILQPQASTSFGHSRVRK